MRGAVDLPTFYQKSYKMDLLPDSINLIDICNDAV